MFNLSKSDFSIPHSVSIVKKKNKLKKKIGRGGEGRENTQKRKHLMNVCMYFG